MGKKRLLNEDKDMDLIRRGIFTFDDAHSGMPYHLWMEVLCMDGVMLIWYKEEIPEKKDSNE